MKHPRTSQSRLDVSRFAVLFVAGLLAVSTSAHAQTPGAPAPSAAATAPEATPSPSPAAEAPPANEVTPVHPKAAPSGEIKIIDGQVDPDGLQKLQEGATAEEELPADGKYPIAEVDTPRFDFGVTWMGGDLEHAFKIRNGGDAPLKISKVKPGCGCTVAGKYPDEIAPGASGDFPFKLNTSKLHGKFTKSITVSTNDPKNRQIQLLLAGEVKQYVDIEPRNVQFGRVKADTVATNKVTLTNNSDQPLELKLEEGADLKCYAAKLEETEAGKKFELTVTAQPPFDTGINRVNIPLKTNLEKQPKLEVTCIATLPQRIELRPDKVQISGPGREASERRVLLTNNGDEPLHVVAVESTDKRIAVESTEIEAGRKYQLAVKIPANYTDPEPNAAIVVKTDDAKDAEVRVPIVGRPTPSAESPVRPAMTMLGQPAPQTKTSTYKGAEITVGGKQDKVQFLAFYASWCGFCKKALPKIEELQKKYKDNPAVEIVAVNLDERSGRRARTEADSISHYEQMGLTVPMVIDDDKEIGKPYKVESFPTMFVVGKSGEIEAVHVGAAADFDSTITTEIDLLLAGKTRADFPGAPSGPDPAALAPRTVELMARPAAVQGPQPGSPTEAKAPSADDAAKAEEPQDPGTPE